MKDSVRLMGRIKYVFYGLALLGVFAVWYWLTLGSKSPIEVYGLGSIDKEVTHLDDLVSVSYLMKKYKNCPGESVRSLSGACGDFLIRVGNPIDIISDVPIKVEMKFRIPMELHSGNCLFSVKIKYYCNLIERVFPLEVNLPSIPFKVE